MCSSDLAALPAQAASGDQLAGLLPSNLGPLELRHEPAADAVFRRVTGSAVAAGRLYTVRHDGIVEGSVQLEQLRPSLMTSDAEVRQGIEQSLGGGSFQRLATPVYQFDGNCLCAATYQLVPVRDQPLHHSQDVLEQDLPDLRVYLWFPRGRDVVEIVALRAEFSKTSADDLVLALVDQAS